MESGIEEPKIEKSWVNGKNDQLQLSEDLRRWDCHKLSFGAQYEGVQNRFWDIKGSCFWNRFVEIGYWAHLWDYPQTFKFMDNVRALLSASSSMCGWIAWYLPPDSWITHSISAAKQQWHFHFHRSMQTCFLLPWIQVIATQYYMRKSRLVGWAPSKHSV